MAFDSCDFQHCLSAEAILKQHHQACSEDSKAVFLGYRAGGLPYTVEYAGCSENGAMASAFFESFVISEIIKSYYNKGIVEPPLYFYRDKDMNEIDLVIEENGTLYPLEMKKHADPQKKDMDAFNLLDKIPGTERGPGGVICLYDRLITLKGNDRVIPINYL